MVTCEKKEAELKWEEKFSQGQEGLGSKRGTVFGTFPIEIWFSVAIEKG